MKTRLFVTFALLLLALSVIPATGAMAAAPAQPTNAPALAQEVAFSGYIQALPNTLGQIGTWKVSGKFVHVSKWTQIDQSDFRVRIGAYVRVEGYKLLNGSYNATSIDVLR